MRDSAVRRRRTASVRRTLLALASLVVLAVVASQTATAKDVWWLRICGENGCKLIKDQGIGAALGTEAEEYGAKAGARASVHVPVYEVSYVLPTSMRANLRTAGLPEPREPTYWLRKRHIQFLIANSQRSVSETFMRATAGIRPFVPAGSHSSNRWKWFALAGAAVLAILAIAPLAARRTRSQRPA
jgi:hypothetical protein